MPPVANPFFATPAQRTALARERYFERGERPLGLVSEPILQSWHRSLAAGHRPEGAPSFDPVSRSQMRATLERNHALLHAAGPEIDQLDTMLAGTDCRTVLTDRHGIVVRASPSLGPGRGVLHVAARVGVHLGEAQVGSTAPGISVAADTPVTVFGGEHFYGALQEVHCAAAPIRDGFGQLVGVLDVSIEGRGFAFDALSLVRLSAAAIENRLLARSARGRLLLRFQASPRLLGTPLEGMAVVDERGRVGWVNPAGAALLAAPAGAPTAYEVEPLFGLGLAALLEATRHPEPQAHRLPSGLLVYLRVGLDDERAPAEPAEPDAAPAPHPAAAEPASPPAPPPGPQPAPADAAATLRATSQQAIEAALARHGGNLSAAARALGVSRGLLYRRLRQRAAG